LSGQHAQRAHDSTSERGWRYERFFRKVVDEFKEIRPESTSSSSVSQQNWFGFSAGRTGFLFSWAFTRDRRFRCELYLDGLSRPASKEAFDALAAMGDNLRASIGLPIAWERLNNRKASRLAVYYPAAFGDNFDDYPRLAAWAVQTMMKLDDVLRSVVAAL
jgi:hypothetical protein